MSERYLGWQADRVPVWRWKLQLPSEDLIKQLLLDIILTVERKRREMLLMNWTKMPRMTKYLSVNSIKDT